MFLLNHNFISNFTVNEFLNIHVHYVVCRRLLADQWFSLGTPVSSTNKTDCQNITELLLKVALNTTTLTYVRKL